MKETDIAIPFTEENVKKFLDDMIDFWHQELDSVTDDNDILNHRLASECYIDAYQSVRISFFGEMEDDDKRNSAKAKD